MSYYASLKDKIIEIRKNLDIFKDDHKMANKAVSVAIDSLPEPFSKFYDIVWNDLERQNPDNSAQKLLELMEKFENTNESLDAIKSKLDQLINSAATNEDLRDLGEKIRISNEDITTILGSKSKELEESQKILEKSPTHQELQIGKKEEKTSRSLRKVISALGNEEITALSIVKEILKTQGEYADRLGRTIHNVIENMRDLGGERKTINDWIREVSSCLKDDIILNDQLFVIGLCLVDLKTGSAVRENNLFDFMLVGIKVYPDVLTEKGLKHWNRLFNLYHDRVSTLKDTPTKLDELGRMSFARFLVDLLYQVKSDTPDKDAFILLIDGTWGSGKSSLLNFIREALEARENNEKQTFAKRSISEFIRREFQKQNLRNSSLLDSIREALALKSQKTDYRRPSPKYQNGAIPIKKTREKKSIEWVTVDFNAWQNQRTGPPWWSLMDTIYTQSRYAIARKSKIRSFRLFLWESHWRFMTKHSNFFLLITITSAIIGTLILTGIIDLPSLTPNEVNNVLANTTQAHAENLTGTDLGQFVNSRFTGIIAFIVAAFSLLGVVRTSLIPGSSQAAREFMEISNDPMRRIQTHFEKMVSKIRDQIIIFIDDLDRCRDSYTVEFLEGIQTLFKKVDVVYVIAADRRWIYSSYEKSYEVFKPSLDQPGFSFGHLFLQKIFQLSVPIPTPSEVLQKSYWNHLISSSPEKNVTELVNAEREAEEKISKSTNEAEWLDEMKFGNQDPVYQQRFRQKAVENLAKPEVQAQIEHMLKPFTGLMEPNPRSMKRFVNMYQIVRATDMLRGGIIEREKLALWTIICFRWPDLAQLLKEIPELIEYINQGRQKIQENTNIPIKLKELFWNQEVINVIAGKGVDFSLEEKDIKEIIGLYGL